MSCRRSRKFLSAPGSPLYITGLNVNFTVLYVKLIDLSYFNSFSEIFEKRAQFNTVKKWCFSDSQFTCIGRLHVASVEAKIGRICFSGVNTGLSE